MLEFQKVKIIRGGGSCALSLKSAFISLFAVNALTASVALCAQTASDMETFDYRVPYKLGLPIIAQAELQARLTSSQWTIQGCSSMTDGSICRIWAMTA